MDLVKAKAGTMYSRTPQGVRGLKYAAVDGGHLLSGRTPQGVRGLKLHDAHMGNAEHSVAPRKGCVD